MPARTRTRTRTGFTRSHLPALAWAAFVAVALAAPGDALAKWSDDVWLGAWLDPLLDKIVHFVLFAVLAALAARSFRELDPSGRGRTLARRPLLAAVLASIAYGALSELGQLWFTARTAELADLAADAAGALCAAGLAWFTRRRVVTEQAAEDSSDGAATGRAERADRREPRRLSGGRSSSRLEHGADLARGRRVFREREGAVIQHLPRGAQEGAKGGAGEGAADADALDADVGELREAQLHALEAHDDVDRAIDGADDGADVVPAGETRGVEDVRAGLLVGLEPPDRVGEVGAADQVVLRPRGQREREG